MRPILYANEDSSSPLTIGTSSGFTLVELLIVAIMLAIVAAIVVPQFASTTIEARESALKSDLENIRLAIDHYRVQHNAYPGLRTSIGGGCTGGAAGTGAAETTQAFDDQLSMYSRKNGAVCTLPVGSFAFGPYVKFSQLPENPITSSNALIIVAAGDASAGDLTVSADGSAGGWKYDVTSGRFIANDTNLDSRGKPFDQY